MAEDSTSQRDSSLTQITSPYLTRGVDLNELLVSLVDTIVKNLAADRGTLYLVDGGRRTLTSMVAHLPELDEIQLSFGQGVAGSVAQTQELVNVPDVRRDNRFDPTFDRRTGYETRSLLVVPVSDSRGETIGVLQLLNAKAGVFNQEDEEKAMRLGKQAGQVLESTSLYADLRSRTSLEGKRPGLGFRFNQIVGQSAQMRRVYGLVEKAARTSATVLLNGESGTGKELIARAIHINSPRRHKEMVKLDCTTLPESLIENALFGHEKGAFTGADKSVPGKFEVADGSTIFLDEIGELPLALQGKLLRVLQDREFERVGGTKTIRTDIRVICATHRNLARMVDEGKFREDLYYRIRVVPIDLPPLRERGQADILRLVEHFVEKFSKRHQRPIERVGQSALQKLQAHRFPGNIRELENLIESAVVLCDDGIIEADDIQFAPRYVHEEALLSSSALAVATEQAASAGFRIGDPNLTLETLEQTHIRQVVEAMDGNQSEAARRLGIGRNTLARKLSLEGLTS